MSNKKNLVIGLLQVNANPWKKIYKEGQYPTWISKCSSDIDIINIYGLTPNKFIRKFDLTYEKLRWSRTFQGPIHIIDRVLTNNLSRINNPEYQVLDDKKVTNLLVKFPSTHMTLPVVEIAFYRYFLNHFDANFLYMSNTSSYVNTDNLQKFVDNISETKKIYGGSFQTFAEVKYASGSNRLLSRDLVAHLVNKFKHWDFSLVEDVSMGKLLESESFTEVNIPSLTFSTVDEINSVNPMEFTNNIHFRLKSGPLHLRKDAELMHLVHSKLT